MKNPSYPVDLTLLKSQQTTSIDNINMNHRRVFQTLSRYASRLHPPAPSVPFSRHASNCIFLNRVFLCCPIFPLFYWTSYYIYPYILLSTFSNFTSSSSTWNLRPARWGITIRRRIKKHTLREHLHVHWRRQPIFIAEQMFALPTQPSSIVLEIANVLAIILMKQDDDDTDQKISDNDSENPGESTLSAEGEDDDLDNQQEVLHLDQAHHDRTIANNKGSTSKEMEPYGYCHCTHFTSKSVASCQGHGTTIAQAPKVNHQHTTQVWCCTRPGAPTSQDWWRPEYSSTKGWRRSQRSSTPNGNFWGSKTIHGGNRIHKDSLANRFWWQVLDGRQSLKTWDWSAGLSASISRCCSWCTIWLSIAWWSIS